MANGRWFCNIDAMLFIALDSVTTRVAKLSIDLQVSLHLVACNSCVSECASSLQDLIACSACDDEMHMCYALGTRLEQCQCLVGPYDDLHKGR